MEFFTEKNRDLYFEYFKINPKQFIKKRILLALLSFVVYLAVIIQFKQPLLWLGLPIVLYLAYKVPYLELIQSKNKSDIVKQYLFPTFLRYFLALIDTQGNVYQTIKATIEYVNEPLKSELEKLVKKLDENNVQNREAFMEFADFINSSESRMIMGILYDFHEVGINKSDLKELEHTLNSLQENKVNELIEYKVDRLNKHADPIMAYGLAFVFGFTGIVLMAYLSNINLNL